MRVASLTLILWSLAVVAQAEPKVTVKREYYTISGKTVADLRREMDHKGILEENGRHNDAYTSWEVSWRFNYQPNAERRCAITSVSTRVEVKYWFPRWENPKDAAQDVRDRWEGYMSALLAHEDEHKNFGISAAHDIEAAILRMAPAPDCAILTQEANALGDNILDQYTAVEIEFDRNTNHGINQGAHFP